MFSIGYIFVIAALFYVYLICSKRLIKKVLIQLRGKIFNEIMKKDMKSYYEQNTSEYISVLTFCSLCPYVFSPLVFGEIPFEAAAGFVGGTGILYKQGKEHFFRL